MSLLCIAAVRRRTIPFWLAVVVAVIGGVGPFAGSDRFRRCETAGSAAASDSPQLACPRPQRMAVGTTVRVEMPQMGESVVRRHRPRVAQAGGRHVEADETLVEISTDKVDAEVPRRPPARW